MENTSKKGFWRSVGEAFGITVEQPNEQRSEPVYTGSVAAPIGNRTSTVVTADKAMSLVSVYRAVSILATATKQLPMGVWRGGVEIDTPSLIKEPSLTGVTRSAIIEETVVSLAVSGNAYWLLKRAGEKAPVQGIEVLNPHNVFIEQDTNTAKVTGYRYGDKTFKPWQIKHMRLLSVPGSPYGLGPIQSAQAALGGALNVRDYASNWFLDSGVPSGVLKTDQILNPDDALRYQNAWDDAQRTGKTRVLSQGLTYSPIHLSPADAQWIEAQQWTKTEIATLFGLPAVFLNAESGDSGTYQNVQQADLSFLKYSLAQYLKVIEDAFTDLIPRGQDARFIVEGFLRADRETRFEGYKTAIEAGFLTVNEVRAIEGYAPLSDAEIAKNRPAQAAPVQKEAQA